MPSRGLTTLIPVVVIAATFIAVALLGFDSSSGISRQQTKEEVTTLLADIPQHGTTLGSPRAPLTLFLFADIECPTVRRFVGSYLPSIIATWVRTGAVKLEYRSLQTDTTNEQVFFEQEIAALAAGRQNRLWNYFLTFVHQQEHGFTNYATDELLTDIASQVPDLERVKWRRDRKDPSLSRQVALSLQDGHHQGFSYTPSFLLAYSSGSINGHIAKAIVRNEVAASLRRDLQALSAEALQEGSEDIPALAPFGSSLRND